MDSTRPLTPKGRSDANNAGKNLVDAGFTPDFILCSPTLRTRETLAEVQKSFPAPVKIEYEQKIYHASDRDLLRLLAATSENVQNLLLVGHNPALHQLAIYLAKTGNEKLIDDLHLQFPPCTMAVISIAGEWKNIDKSSEIAGGELVFFATPEMA